MISLHCRQTSTTTSIRSTASAFTLTSHTALPHFGSASDCFHCSAPSSSSSSHLTLLLPFLGSTLLHYSSYFRVYQSYLENYDDAIKHTGRSYDVSVTCWTCGSHGMRSVKQPPSTHSSYSPYSDCRATSSYCRKSSSQKTSAAQPTPPLAIADSSSGLFTHYPQGYTDILTAREKISRIAEAINSSLHDKETAAVVAHLQSSSSTTPTSSPSPPPPALWSRRGC